MLKYSSKYLFFLGLIAIFGGSQSLNALPNFFDSISSLFGGSKAIEPAQQKIDASNVPDGAMPLVVRQKPKTPQNQVASLTCPAPVAEKHGKPWLDRLAGTKRAGEIDKAIKLAQDTAAKLNVDSGKTLKDMRETTLLIRFTVIPVAILSCVLMVKSIFPNWFPGSTPKKIIGKCELD